jgi:hypothetical protein
MNTNKSKRFTLPMVLALAMAGAGCIGPFNAINRVHTWNREIDNRWAGEGVYLVLRILPVYALCFVGDVLVFNSIEFWGWENPVDPPAKERVMALREADAARAAEADKD